MSFWEWQLFFLFAFDIKLKDLVVSKCQTWGYGKVTFTFHSVNLNSSVEDSLTIVLFYIDVEKTQKDE